MESAACVDLMGTFASAGFKNLLGRQLEQMLNFFNSCSPKFRQRFQQWAADPCFMRYIVSLNMRYSLIQMNDTSVVHELTENKSQHHRGIDSASKDGSLQATQRCIHMLTEHVMHDVFIIDSGAAVHCSGHRSLLTEYAPKRQPDETLRGVSGKVMQVHGVGNICNGMIQIKDVKYMPGLNTPNINKTIVSVRELTKLDYHVHFDEASFSVTDRRNRTWSWKSLTWTHEIVGEGHVEHNLYLVDYLRIPFNRVPVREGPTLAAKLWRAASSGWTSMAGLLSRTQEVHAERVPV